MKDFCIFKGVVLVYSFHLLYYLCWAFLVTQTVKNLAAMQETQVQSLGQEDPLEKRMTLHSSILAWSFPWTEQTVGLQSTRSQRVRYDWATNTLLFCFNIKEFFCVFLPPLLISSASVRCIPFLPFIDPIFAWNVPLVSLTFLKRSLIFPILLFSSISLHWSLKTDGFLISPCYSLEQQDCLAP